MRFVFGLARAVVGFTLLFAFLAAVPILTAFVVMMIVPPVYILFWHGQPELLALTGFGFLGFVATLAVTRGLARLQDWIVNEWYNS